MPDAVRPALREALRVAADMGDGEGASLETRQKTDDAAPHTPADAVSAAALSMT